MKPSSISALLLILFSIHLPWSVASAEERNFEKWCCDFWQPKNLHRPMWGRSGSNDDIGARMRRHWTFMHEGIPKVYEGARSSVKHTDAVIAAGRTLYKEHCQSCHGRQGLGDGAAAKGLSPSPALLAFMVLRPMAVDEYLLWTISEGGEKFKTDMPAFKDVLSKEEIWKIIAFMRVGFPSKK